MKASVCHTFTIPSRRCCTTYVQHSKNSDQNCCHGNIFTVHFSSVTLFNNHHIRYNYKTISHISFKFGLYIRIHAENILLSKMTLNSHFYKTNSDLNLQKCLLHTLTESISYHFTFFILLRIALGVNNETLFKMTLNSQIVQPP